MGVLGFGSLICVSSVTSRPEFDIQAIPERLKPHHERRPYTTKPMTLSTNVNHVSHVVRPDPRRWRWQEEDKDPVIKTRSEKASGYKGNGRCDISYDHTGFGGCPTN
jgi:hypothetical protein